MSSFKRFNTSNNSTNYNGNEVFEEGTLTWDAGNGLRLHDGNTSGGNSVGGNNYSGTSAIHDMVFGGGSSADNGKFLQQINTNQVQWGDGVQLWKTATNVANPELTVPDFTVNYYGGNVNIINSTGSDTSYTWAGRLITSTGSTSIHSGGTGIVSTESAVVSAISADRGNTLVLDHIYNANTGGLYRVTVVIGWSQGNQGQIMVERLM
jgi:hypothetical protein